MNNTTNTRAAKLERQLSAVAGVPVTLTVRGERSFTFSFDSVNDAAVQRLRQFFAGQPVAFTTAVDVECGTCVYAEVR